MWCRRGAVCGNLSKKPALWYTNCSTIASLGPQHEVTTQWTKPSNCSRNNVEWVFSGIGTYVVAGIVSLVPAVLGILIRRAWAPKYRKSLWEFVRHPKPGGDVNINTGRRLVPLSTKKQIGKWLRWLSGLRGT